MLSFCAVFTSSLYGHFERSHGQYGIIFHILFLGRHPRNRTNLQNTNIIQSYDKLEIVVFGEGYSARCRYETAITIPMQQVPACLCVHILSPSISSG